MNTYELKLPILGKQKGQLGQLGQLDQSSKKVFSEPKISNIGISFIVVFYSCFLYIYLSSWFKSKKIYLMTVSNALIKTERIGSTVLFVLMAALQMGLLIEKGFVSEGSSSIKKSLVAVLFSILLGFLLLFLIPPTITSLRLHILITGIILSFMIFSSYAYIYIYTDVYNSTGNITNMENITYSLTVFTILVMVFFIISGFFKKYKKFSNVIAILEIIIIVLYGSVVAMLSTLPKLVDLEKICFGVEIK